MDEEAETWCTGHTSWNILGTGRPGHEGQSPAWAKPSKKHLGGLASSTVPTQAHVSGSACLLCTH